MTLYVTFEKVFRVSVPLKYKIMVCLDILSDEQTRQEIFMECGEKLKPVNGSIFYPDCCSF